MLSLPVQYQYRCRLTGVVKAYKQMTPQKAEALNNVLESQGAHGRWAPHLVFAKAQLERVSEPLAVA